MDTQPVGITARKQRRAAGRTDRLRYMEIGELAPLARQPVQVWRLEPLRALATQIAIALIVGEDDHHIRQPLGGEGRARCPARQPERQYWQPSDPGNLVSPAVGWMEILQTHDGFLKVRVFRVRLRVRQDRFCKTPRARAGWPG